MRNSGLFFFMISLILLFLPCRTEAYQENFEDGKADEWQTASGDWQIENGEYVQLEVTAQGGGEARNRAAGYAVGDTSWTDYTFQVMIKPISSINYAGVMFRVGELDGGPDGNTFRDTSQYYYWLIGIGGTYSKIWQAPACKVLEESPGDTLKVGEWNEVKVEMKGQNTRLYLNGKEQKDFNFPEDVQIEAGGIALATYNASASFDDVKAEGPGLAVNPGGKAAIIWGELKRLH